LNQPLGNRSDRFQQRVDTKVMFDGQRGPLRVLFIIMQSRRIKSHDCYCRLLNRIGEALGYDTKIPRDERYHLANPDSVWFGDSKIGLPKVPLVTFEVLYSELHKAIRGSLQSFQITGSPVGILVVLEEGYRKIHRHKDQTPEQRVKAFKDYAKRLIEAQGLKRYYVWDQSDVDKLVQGLGMKP